MPPATSEGRPVGRPTSFSSPEFVDFNYWAPADLVIGAGAVVLRAAEGKVLVLWDPVTRRYRFPWARRCDKEDLGQFVASPFDQISDETGYVLEKVALPKLSRRYKNPHARDWRELEVDLCMDPARSTDDPFFMTFDVFWFKIPESEWLDSRQRMMMWFACRAVSGEPANDNVVWMSFEEAAEKIGNYNREHPDAGSCAALKQLVAIVENPATQLSV